MADEVLPGGGEVMNTATENRTGEKQASTKRNWFRSVLWIILGMGLGVILGWVAAKQYGDPVHDRTIAMTWDEKYGDNGKNSYGAQVYLEPRWGYYSVRARVRIGPGNGRWHDCEEIGQAKTVEEAIENWGTIRWAPEGLYIGDPANGGYHLPRQTMKSH